MISDSCRGGGKVKSAPQWQPSKSLPLAWHCTANKQGVIVIIGAEWITFDPAELVIRLTEWAYTCLWWRTVPPTATHSSNWMHQEGWEQKVINVLGETFSNRNNTKDDFFLHKLGGLLPLFHSTEAKIMHKPNLPVACTVLSEIFFFKMPSHHGKQDES